MPTLSEIIVHAQLTRRSAYSYQFTPKHHGADAGAAQWLPSLSLEEEFEVFDAADLHELADSDGNLYGVLRDVDGLRILGTWSQQVAEFPATAEGQPWHGYPLYPLNEGPENRQGERLRPAKVVFERMRAAGLLTKREQKRLWKGKEV